MKRKIIVFALALAIPVLVGLVYFHFYNENSSYNMECGFHNLTGLQCPGCGGQRAFHSLLHGEIPTALRYNAIFILGLPLLLYMYFVVVEVHGLKNRKYVNGFIYSSKFAKLALITIIVFFILRNIPVTPFIYLSPPG